MTKLSALIITYNEEINMLEVLSNISFADEIIVVDSFSTDNTKNICKNFDKVQFFERKFDNYTSQRNYALNLAKNNWVLFIDADERIPTNLKSEIDCELKNPKHVAYYFYRKFYFKKKPIHFSGTQNDKRIVLFNKKNAQYLSSKLVHETLDVKGTIGYFSNKLIHYSFDSYEEYKEKMIFYGKLKAKELNIKGKKYNFLKHFLKVGHKFLKSYVFKLGFLDGKNGIDVCYLQTYSVHITYKELKNM